MTSSTASNSIMASLARNTPSHRAILTPRSIFRSRTSSSAHARRVRSIHRRRMSASSAAAPVPVAAVDVNNNSSSNPNPASVPLVVPAKPGTPLTLDCVAILKAFAASQSASEQQPTGGSTSAPCTTRPSRFEKPTSYREARRLRLHHQSDPAIEQEFVRLRDTVPSIAGSKVSDLTIINEAISLICDLESQLMRKLKCQNLPAIHTSSGQ